MRNFILDVFPSRPPEGKNKCARFTSRNFDRKIITKKQNLFFSNKKAFLLASETLKIVIAVICIGFLIYFLTALYFNNAHERKLNSAKLILTDSDENIELVVEKVLNLQGSLQEGKAEEFEFVNPVGWGIFSFVVGTSEELPNSCAGTSCLCICRDRLIESWGMQAKECSDKGACLIVSELEFFEKIKIQDGVNKILIENKYGGIFVNEL